MNSTSNTSGFQQPADTADATQSRFQRTNETETNDSTTRATENSSTVCPGCGGTHEAGEGDALMATALLMALMGMGEPGGLGVTSAESREETLERAQKLANENNCDVTAVFIDGTEKTVHPKRHKGGLGKLLGGQCSMM